MKRPRRSLKTAVQYEVRTQQMKRTSAKYIQQGLTVCHYPRQENQRQQSTHCTVELRSHGKAQGLCNLSVIVVPESRECIHIT